MALHMAAEIVRQMQAKRRAVVPVKIHRKALQIVRNSQALSMAFLIEMGE